MHHAGNCWPRPSAARRPNSALDQPPTLQELDLPGPRWKVSFAEFGDEQGTAPAEPRAIRRWEDSGEWWLTAGSAESKLSRATETSYRFLDYGSEQVYRGAPRSVAHQPAGERMITVPAVAPARETRNPSALLRELSYQLPGEQRHPGVLGYWVIRGVVERMVLAGMTMPPAARALHIRALQLVEEIEISAAASNPAGGPNDQLRLGWINAVGTAFVGVRFDARTGLVNSFLDQRFLDNRTCMPREQGQCTRSYSVEINYQTAG